MIGTIVFDFGKVVAFFDHRLASRRLAAFTTQPEPRIFQFLYGGQLEDDYDSGRISTAAFLDVVRRGCELECSDRQLISAYSEIFWPNQGVCDLIPQLVGTHRLLLLSNTNELHARQFLPQLREPLSHFQHLILSHQVKARKPRREIFVRAQELADCGPAECLFIDDVAGYVEGARQFGWNGIVFQNSDQLRRDLKTFGIVATGSPPTAGDPSRA
jgi:putative hydrolase of the HAD superfamily